MHADPTPRSLEQLDADVVVVGAGFAGSLTAMALRSRGHRVVLVERRRHPRFIIGESSTPLANLLLKELADRYDLPGVRPFTKWGLWRRHRPDVAVGLKRGFSFFFHRQDEPWADDEERSRQLLVAASPRDEVGDTHWYRQEFDQELARQAERAGVVYLDATRLDAFRDEGHRVILEGTRNGSGVRLAAGFVVDASGPRGFLFQTLGLKEAPLHWLPPTRGLYTHFENVRLWEQVAEVGGSPPFPADDAAVHHLFPGGWIWVLRFANGLVSAGAALTESRALEIRAHEGAPAWVRLLESLPSLQAQFGDARTVRPFVRVRRLGFRTRDVVGRRWALLPSAVGFIDPLLSTGFPLTLLGIHRLVDLLASSSDGGERNAALQHYARATVDELDVTEQLIAALYATMTDTTLFKRLSLLYFAAASYSEAARRLGKPELAPGFLLHAHPRFGPELRACAAVGMTAPQGDVREALLTRIDRAIEPFDVAGLLDRSRRDWYPVIADDLVAGAPKLEATLEEIIELLETLKLRS